MKNVHFFAESKRIVANKKAVDGGNHDVIVRVTVIRMVFTMTDEHRVASFSLPTYHPLPTSLVVAIHAMLLRCL